MKLNAGNEYVFRVSAENKYGVGKGLHSCDVVAVNSFTAPAKMPTPEIASVTKESVTLFWSRPRHDGGAEITGYTVEKRTKMSTKWMM